MRGTRSSVQYVVETAAYLTDQPPWLWRNIVEWRMRRGLPINIEVMVKG